jgi:hypothetical protein
MKVSLNNIIFVVSATSLITLMINVPAASEPMQPSVNDLVYSSSFDFFNDGRKQFDREVELLMRRKDSVSKPILMISPEIRKKIEELQQPINKSVILEEMQKSSQVERE